MALSASFLTYPTGQAKTVLTLSAPGLTLAFMDIFKYLDTVTPATGHFATPNNAVHAWRHEGAIYASLATRGTFIVTDQYVCPLTDKTLSSVDLIKALKDTAPTCGR